MAEPRYKIQWQTTEGHEAVLSLARVAEILGITEDEVQAAYEAGVLATEGYGGRGLDNALSEVEGDETYDGCTERDYITVEQAAPSVLALVKDET